VHRDLILIVTAVVCLSGCISNGSSKSLNNPNNALSSNMTPTGSVTPGPMSAAWWTNAWEKNPVADWLSKEKKTAATYQSMSQQPQVPKVQDPISLGFASGEPSAQLYVSMAELSDKGGNTDQARELYQKAYSLEPDDLPALLGHARLEDRQGRLDDAIPIYQKAITAHPQNTTLLNDLAICYARKKQLQTSLNLLEQAVQLQPDKLIYRNNIAKVLTEMDRQEEALVHLAVVHPPAVAHYNLGFLLAQRGRMEEATQFLAQATAIDPEMHTARILHDQLNPTVPPNSTDPVSSDDSVQLAQRQVDTRYPMTLPVTTSVLPVGISPLSLPPVN
jgi:tetratricopeptide (TPR) repeat protein